MKRGHSFALGLLALALAACGGHGESNGGDTGGNPTTALGLSGQPRIEAILFDPTSDPDFIYADPLNIQVRDSVVFQLVNYTDAGERVVLSADAFRTNDAPIYRAGLLTATSGRFQAASNGTGVNSYIVSTTYNGNTYSALYKVNPRQILLRGRILAEGSNAPVYNATLDFYAPTNPAANSGVQRVVATVRTAVDGTFRVSLPAFNDDVDTNDEAAAAAKIRFTVRSSSLPAGYYPSFVFKGKRYDAGSSVCRPVLLSNTQASDGTEFLPYTTGDRLLADPADPENTFNNGTILLVPKSAFPEKPEANGCTLDE